MRVVQVFSGRHALRVRGTVAAVLLGLGTSTAVALDRLDIVVAGGSEDLTEAVLVPRPSRTAATVPRTRSA